VAVEIAAALGFTCAIELALGFAAPMQRSIGGGFLFRRLSRCLFASPAKIGDVAHSCAPRASPGGYRPSDVTSESNSNGSDLRADRHFLFLKQLNIRARGRAKIAAGDMMSGF
jgi:hypothetical protein